MNRCVALALLLLGATSVRAGDVEIVRTVFDAQGEGTWQVSVTLLHGDTGWDHYADAWRVVDDAGNVLGTRTLFHPHENEQPFTRSLGGVRVAPGTRVVRVQAHDKVHGWAPVSLEVDLGHAAGERYEVRR